jgi:uronate dehydrogenase
VFEAAVRARVPRIVFASTVQTVEGYGATVRVPADAEPRPISVYGCTKVFGEVLGRYHSDVSGLGVACLRLGAVRPPGEAEEVLRDGGILDLWLASSDLARLVIAAIRSDVPFATVTAVSPPATRRFDTTNPFGWTPTERPTCVSA